MRLIDADALDDKLGTSDEDINFSFNVLDEQPTAFDVEKVIEELSVIEDMSNYQTYLKAVEIVKKGGLK